MIRTPLSRTLIVAALGASLCCVAFTPALTEVDGRSVPQIAWDTTLKKFQFDQDKFLGHRFTAMCPPAPASAKAPADEKPTIYPANHAICLAGLHAGAIDADGGQVTVQLNPGGALHAGGAGAEKGQNISVVGAGDADAVDTIYRDSVQRIDWDTKFTKTGVAYKQLIGQRFTFHCPKAPSNLINRRVVGTDAYAFQSMICRAAVHAGTTTMEGGLVTVQMNPPVKKLAGSTRNGVETKDGTSGLSALTFVENPITP